MQSTSRAEAERLLGIAEKLLQSKDLNGSRDFAHLAQETEPLLDGSDQILAVVDVLLAAEKQIHNQPNWYAVLQLDGRQNDDELIKRQYRKLALLLHPDKNKFPFADSAFKLVADAWAVVSDPERKSAYDSKLFAFEKVDLEKEKQKQNQRSETTPIMQRDKIPVRRNPADGGTTAVNQTETTATATATATETTAKVNIWTACPYCYNLYEYPKIYEGCCLRCANCKRAFQAVAIPPASLPQTIPGKEAYYCCWSYFPMGFAMANSETAKSLTIPNWMPPIVPTNVKAWPVADSLPNGSSVPLAEPGEAIAAVTTLVAPPKPILQKTTVAPPKPTSTPPTAGATVPRKRGRPRKSSLP
ncbi:putative DnaJ domain, Chaperone J-domain superfamily [Helianthus annuus]|nr:putative DnaJ domain, Chaperone J-domain superfamily [Helianthus annuus]